MSKPQFAQIVQQIQELLATQQFEQILKLINSQTDELRYNVQFQKICALVLIKLARYEDARDTLLKIHDKHPELHDIKHNLAIAYAHLNDYDTAIEYANKALELEPLIVKYNLHLSELHKVNKQLLKALRALRIATLKGVNDDALYCELAALSNTTFEYLEALNVLQNTQPSFYSILLSLEARIHLNHYDEAMSLLPDLIKLLATAEQTQLLAFSEMLSQLGEFAKAEQILSANRDGMSFELAYSRLQTGYYQDTGIADLVNDPVLQNLPTEQQRNLDFVLSKHYFKSNDTAKGFEYCHRANAANKPDEAYQADVSTAFKRIKTTYVQNPFNKIKGCDSTLPVFIIGMPRSGTTLLENMIAAHSQAFGAGETPYLNLALNDMDFFANTHLARLNYLANISAWSEDEYQHMCSYYLEHLKAYDPHARIIVDKLPHNFMHLGVIRHLFPQARIIHIKRNPIATCLSIYKENMGDFHLYGNDLDYLTQYYRRYEDLMAFWKEQLNLDNFLEVSYENLIQDSEYQIRNILAFIGLNYEPKCLNFHVHGRAVKTLSKEQVRSALYTTSLTPWVGVETEIKPLIENFKANYSPSSDLS